MIRVRCPICDRVIEGQGPAEWPQFPFCSERCRLIDLGRWLGGDYRIAATRAEEEEAPAPHRDDEDIP
jgi:endogenous inhibitor of DNA gyrase (YacG/DUF329 family)